MSSNTTNNTKVHTKKDAEYCLWYIRKHIFPRAKLIGSLGKGAEVSLNDIDIYVPKSNRTNKNKKIFTGLLDAKEVVDTDWGGWFFYDTPFGNVDIFFDITEFDY